MRPCLRRLSAAVFCLVVFGAQAVFAADYATQGEDISPDVFVPHTETAGHAAHAEGAPGLPQLDVSTFPSQLFWLGITFAILYLYFSRKALPNISSVLENRREHVQGDLDMAERVRREAEEAQNTYEKLMNDARVQATKLMTDAESAVRARAESELARLRDKAAGDAAVLDKRLSKEKQSAMAEMDHIAADIASRAAEKITGIKPDLKQAQTVVQSLNRREAA